MSQSDSVTLEPLAVCVKQRENALNRERILRSAVEFVLDDECVCPAVREVCRMALDETESHR